MSIINRMLQDLDRRQGMAGSEQPTPIAQVRSVAAARSERDWFWRIIAALMIVSLGWVAWIAWQLQPRDPVATPQAFKAAERAKRPVPIAAATPAIAPVAVNPPPVSAPISAPVPAVAPAPAPVPVAPAAPAPAVKSAPAPARAAPAAPRIAAPEPPLAQAQPVRNTPATEKSGKAADSPKRLGLDVPPARILSAPVPAGVRVQKQDRVRSEPERAEMEFRRAAALLNQGRVSEAEEAFSAALAISSAHESARQALIALYLEQQRIDDAQKLLQEGLAANPSNVQYALVLARILVGRREYARALEVLGGARPSAISIPEYDALVGNVLQRQGRHAEAADAFRSVLRSAPGNGAAWASLGISLESVGRRPEAIEAFQRALASVSPGSEIGRFAEQQLRGLR